VAWHGDLNVGFLGNYNDSVAVPGSPPRATASTILMETVGMSTVTKTHRYWSFKYLQPIHEGSGPNVLPVPTGFLGASTPLLGPCGPGAALV
jgi:hypothetical protein